MIFLKSRKYERSHRGGFFFSKKSYYTHAVYKGGGGRGEGRRARRFRFSHLAKTNSRR